MELDITHSAFLNINMKDQIFIHRVFKDVKTVKELIRNIKKCSGEFEKFGYPDSAKLRGELFEIFSEIFFKLFSSDGRVGVYEYKPTHAIDDYGVDAFAKSLTNEKVAIQAKFRSNITAELLASDLKQFTSNAVMVHKVVPKKANFILITTGKGMHFSYSKQIGEIRIIAYKDLSKWLDNNTGFWDNLQNLIKQR
jgi:hypothetical protein